MSSRAPQPAAVSLTPAQQAALLSLRHKLEEDEDRRRWIALIFALFLLLFLLFGAPLFDASGLDTARAALGPRWRIAAMALSVAALIGALQPLVSHVGGRSLLQQVRGLALQVVACCIILITVSLYTAGPTMSGAVGFSHRLLPWGLGFALFVFALEHLLRAARHLAHDLAYGLLVLALATGGLFGSYRAVARALAREQRRPATLRAEPAHALTVESAAVDGEDPTHAPADPAGAPQPVPEQPESESQRHELGASEQDDLRPAQDLERTRRHGAEAIEDAVRTRLRP